MQKQNFIVSLLEQFDASANEYSKKTGAVFCETDCEYKKSDVKSARARISYNSFVIEFKFNTEGTMGLNKNILECLVHFDKSFFLCPVPLPLVVDFLDIDTPSLLCVPYISNGDGMREAFASIESVLDDMLDEIKDISESTERKIEIFKYFIGEAERVLKVKFPMPIDEYARKTVCEPDEETFYPDEYFYSYLCYRFSSPAFVNSLGKQINKSIRQLEKLKDRFSYEERVLRIWKNGDVSSRAPLTSVAKSAEYYGTNGAYKSNGKEFVALFISWIILTLAISPAYIAVYFGLYFLEGRDSVYLMGPIYYFPVCIFMGFITAIAASYFTRLKFYRLFFKKDYENYAEIDSMNNGGGAERFMKGFLKLIVSVSLVLCVLFTKQNINFTQLGFTDNTKFFSLKGEFYSYDEIDHVYYKTSRTNDFGDTLDFPSYVIVLKDGTEIDLYKYDNTEKCEENIIGYLRDKGIEIKK